MYVDRRDLYEQLESMLGSKLLVYVTGDRPGWETQIGSDCLDYFLHHLDNMDQTEKITLFLYTRGGSTLAAWSIVNLIRQFTDNFNIIVPSKSHSAGTLMCLGANSIMMTKQATLGPIDPSINTPLNPQIPGGNPSAKYAVSVEAIKGFFELAKSELSIKDDSSLSLVLNKLADVVHPLVLGEVYRAKEQIQMLAKKLLVHQDIDPVNLDEIVSFLVSESGSHDYTIYRREAKEELGLNVISPSPEEYDCIKRIYTDISEELELSVPYNQEQMLGGNGNAPYGVKRVLIESLSGGSHYFASEGELRRVQMNTPQGQQFGIQDLRNYEGWRYQHVPNPIPNSY
ncbi:SDH family Clp fold serine proteinase [Paenibacillus xylanilyticus]|uniref:SDH family Clp fold serine proteinase n=1 Tax=Paenibacillus xylanilyticus TaxID=248903 RepID=UPI00129E9915|nr:ATP-dependent Clp protease proteolytic subunit [Paenibacillus xylanilyticus]